MDPVIIIGTGLAGYQLARELRKLDAHTPLLLVSRDDGSYYYKPSLSSALASGKQPQQLVLKDAMAMARELGARIVTHTAVTRIDSAAHVIHTAREGEAETRWHYSALVLALGAAAIRMPLAGDAAAQVLSVNNLDDYRRFRERLARAERVAVIGSGLIGCEFANDLVATGTAVTVIGRDDWPLASLVPRPIGMALQRVLRQRGCDWRLGTTVQSITASGQGFSLMLDNGDTVTAELVLSAVGLAPVTALAQDAGLDINRGIVTDRHLRCSAADVYALGDCAEVCGLNLPFVAPIGHCARALARTLAGRPSAVSYPAMPVIVKTSLYPVVSCPPPRDCSGDWQLSGDDSGLRALFMRGDGTQAGFALGGTAVSARQQLAAALPPLLGAPVTSR